MYQFLIGIILALSGFSYYLWQQNEVLQDNNVKLENAVATQQETIETLQKEQMVIQTLMHLFHLLKWLWQLLFQVNLTLTH